MDFNFKKNLTCDKNRRNLTIFSLPSHCFSVFSVPDIVQLNNKSDTKTSFQFIVGINFETASALLFAQKIENR